MGEKRILIVEDDADISMIEEAYLNTAGLETKIVSEGSQVVPLLEKERFDLILLDLMLPDKSGYEICKEIRDKLDIPILMVTARTESVDKLRGFGAGADDYISKPFDPAELVARVNANLRQYERSRFGAAKKSEKNPDEIVIGDLRILTEGRSPLRILSSIPVIALKMVSINDEIIGPILYRIYTGTEPLAWRTDEALSESYDHCNDRSGGRSVPL